MKIHEKIRALRKEKHWTQEDMAGKLGMSVVGYAKIERGETDYQLGVENCLSKLARIANVLEIDLQQLVADGEKHIYLISGDNNSGDNACNVVIGSPTELAFEIQKLQLIIKNKDAILEHKNEMLAQKDKEIEALKEINVLLKNTQNL
jgi:transcriptional regulator with XRE-family HTH domain